MDFASGFENVWLVPFCFDRTGTVRLGRLVLVAVVAFGQTAESLPDDLDFDSTDPKPTNRVAGEHDGPLPTTTSDRKDLTIQHAPVLRRVAVSDDQPVESSSERQGDNHVLMEDLPTVEELERRVAEITESSEIETEQKDTLKSLLEHSLEWLKNRAEAKQKADRLIQEAEAAPKLAEDLKQKLRAEQSDPALPETGELALPELVEQSQRYADELAATREQLHEHQTRASQLQAVRKENQEKQRDYAAQHERLEAELSDELPPDLSPLHAELVRIEQRTHLALILAREKLLKVEANHARSTTALLPLQHDLLRRGLARLEELKRHFDSALTVRRQEEARERILIARQKARDADPALRALAKGNAELADALSESNVRLRKAASELTQVKDKTNKQEEAFQSIKAKVEEVGMTEAIGVLLRSQAHELIDGRPLKQRALQIEKELPRVELELIEVRDQREAMWDMGKLIELHVRGLTSRFEETEAREMVSELLETRRQYLAELLGALHNLEETLLDLHIALEHGATLTTGHHRYITEHVLWIRSADGVSVKHVKQARIAAAELFAFEKWERLVADLGAAIQARLVLSLSLFALLTICLVLCDRLKDRIVELGKSKAVTTSFRFAPTAEVACWTVVLASFLPATCFGISQCIRYSGTSSSLTLAIGIGLQWTSAIWLGLSLLQQVVLTGGLAERHFGWHTNNLEVIRRNLALLTTFGLPIVFTVMVIETYQDGKWVDSLGRLSFMSGMCVMALFMHRLLDPYQSGRATRGLWANKELLVYRVRHVLHMVSVAIPIALSAVAAVGYVYSAHQLAYRAQLSLWMVLLVVLAQSMAARYLLIARRKATVRQLHRRRAEADENGTEVPVEEELDFQEIGVQLQRLLRGVSVFVLAAGALLIWVDMVPALMMLDRVELWSTTQMVSEKVEIDGQIEIRDKPRVVTITIANVLLGLFVIGATVASARNLPGLLNVTVFERLPIDYGTRYALTAVSRYAISLAGVVAAFYLVGVTWGSVQWLVAAMTVGLGFGLQEIFANFVSGLIILTERPVRVGDMVTVGGITGKVTRVQIRATTITDFDRRELVVPNKRFITEDVINWTLSDPVTRLVLPVGIAYDCDPELARQTLLRVASEHPLVLKEPEPSAIFMGFGDSTLDLELRVFMVGRDQVFEVRDELNRAINVAFRGAKLEIAYPQRDLHIRSVDGMQLPKTNIEAQQRAA